VTGVTNKLSYFRHDVATSYVLKML